MDTLCAEREIDARRSSDAWDHELERLGHIRDALEEPTAICEREAGTIRYSDGEHEATLWGWLKDAVEHGLAPRSVLDAFDRDVATIESRVSPHLPPNGHPLDYICIFRLGRGIRPEKARLIPWPATFSVPTIVANAICLELNERQLAEPQAGYWYVMCRCTKPDRCRIVRVLLPSGWLPSRPDDLPPGATRHPYSRLSARRAAATYNQAQLDLPAPPRYWALVIRRPELDLRQLGAAESIQERLKVQYNRCAYCGAGAREWRATVDHVRPRSHGGMLTDDNVVLCCDRCNQVKGDRTPEEWARDILAGAQRTLAAVDAISSPEHDLMRA